MCGSQWCMTDYILVHAALYARAIPSVALVCHSMNKYRLTRYVLPLYLERYLGTPNEIREGLPSFTPGELLQELADLWDCIQSPRRRIRPRLCSILYNHRGRWKDHDHSRLHVQYRLPCLVLEMYRREHRGVLALIY